MFRWNFFSSAFVFYYFKLMQIRIKSFSTFSDALFVIQSCRITARTICTTRPYSSLFFINFLIRFFFSRALNQRFYSFSSTTNVRISSWSRERKKKMRICVSKITIAVVKTNLWLLHTKSKRQQHEIKAKTFVTVN